MADERRIYLADYEHTSIKVYEIIKETERLFKVHGLTYGSFERQLFKDNSRIRFSLEDARQLLHESLLARIASYRRRIAEDTARIDRIFQLEPEWKK